MDTYHPQTSFNYSLRIHVSLYHTDVRSPTIEMVTLGENSISLEWSPPSEGDPLSYTVTWTAGGGTSSSVLQPAAHSYTIRGLDSNTAYSGTVEVHALTNNATVPWEVYTLPQGELVSQSRVLHRLQNSFLADEDLRGQNVLLLTSLLREVFKAPREKVC